jgi:hypothetical protein
MISPPSIFENISDLNNDDITTKHISEYGKLMKDMCSINNTTGRYGI